MVPQLLNGPSEKTPYACQLDSIVFDANGINMLLLDRQKVGQTKRSVSGQYFPFNEMC